MRVIHPFKRISARQKSLSDDFRRGGDDHEGVRVVRVNEAAERQRLRARQDGDDHRLALMMECAVNILERRAAMQIDGDELDDRFGIGRDDLEALLHSETVHHIVHQNGFHQQTQDTEQTCLNAEAE